MGLDITSVRYHLWLKKQGVTFERVAMLGRHTYYGLTPSSLSKAAGDCGFPMSEDEANELLTKSGGYVEPFYHWLGAETVDSFDYSDYEDATCIWDMNNHLPDEFRDRYDFVFDGGTLEHVFRYSDALREAMTLPKTGGVFLSATPANSYLGHGFYQFGPDLPFSVLVGENGYNLRNVHLVEMRHRAVFHEVLPPGQARGRALASTSWPALMFFWGTRKGSLPEKLLVLQPDYAAAWKGESHSERGVESKRSMISKALNGFPYDVRNDLLRLAKLGYITLTGNAFFDKKCFVPDKRI